MLFWIVTSLLALTVAALLGMVLLRGRVAEDAAASYDLRVYRDQLRDVEKDVARGVIDGADAERVRTEISRRILAADARGAGTGSGASQPQGLSVATALCAAVLVIGGALWLYRDLGAPGYGDLSLERRIEIADSARANRPSQATAQDSLPPRPPTQELSQQYLELVEKLRATVAERPDDIQGHALLARNEATIGNFTAAHQAQAEVLRLKGSEITAQDLTDYSDMLILAAGGYVSPEAESALRAALDLDPDNGIARYYWGLMLAQTGRPDQAFRIWAAQLRDGPQDAPWIAPIREQIEDMAERAGVRYDIPPLTDPAPGPSAEDVEAASEMSDLERAEMIQGMVMRLSERLANDGGPPSDWARLITALSVLGDVEQASAVYENAKEVFGAAPDALDVITRAAQAAGISQ